MDEKRLERYLINGKSDKILYFRFKDPYRTIKFFFSLFIISIYIYTSFSFLLFNMENYNLVFPLKSPKNS